MSTATNPLCPPLKRLFHRLVDLRGEVEMLKGLLAQEQEAVDTGSSPYARGTSVEMGLLVLDLTYKSGDRGNGYVPSGVFYVRCRDDHLRWIKEVLQHNVAWSVAQGYEAFDTCLREFAAYYLHLNPEAAKKKEVETFEKDVNCGRFKSSDKEYWQLFVRYRTKPEKLLSLLRKHTPGLEEAEEQGNHLNVNLPIWLAVLSEVRHATTHAEMVIKTELMSKWTNKHKQYLSRDFPGEYTDAGYRLQLEDNMLPLSMVGMYAYTLFKLLSIKLGIDWNVSKDG